MFLTDGPRVFVVLLNYQSAGDLVRCLASVRRSQERDIRPVIVDNASGNGDVARLSKELGPTIPILESPHNGGYAHGNNLGIRYALDRDVDFVWILNPDTQVEPDTLQMLMTTMALRPDAGFVGSLNLHGDSDPATIQFAGGSIDWDAGVVTHSIGLGTPLASYNRRDAHDVDYVAGTSMLVRRKVFDEVGFLPERYFMYFEETDFQVQAARHGWKSVLNPLAKVWHHQSSTRDLPAPYYTYYYIRNRMLFAKGLSRLNDAEIERGLAGFIDGWRARVAERAPDWLDTHNRLVSMALSDGRAGVTGPRAEVDAMRRPAA
ncbi:MAG: glycosyltransferase family 2 protein [bacterium]|nr:glycosyltransferase family 2 protein [bacterium]